MHAHKTRVDLGMRLVADVDDFETVGKLMDEIASIVGTALDRAHLTADFDYTHFNTHPCKASLMEQRIYHGMGAMDPDSDQPMPALTAR